MVYHKTKYESNEIFFPLSVGVQVKNSPTRLDPRLNQCFAVMGLQGKKQVFQKRHGLAFLFWCFDEENHRDWIGGKAVFCLVYGSF